jgi:hypothetical protein
MPNPPFIPRAPAARLKLEAAEQVLAGLSGEIALLSLGASEGAPGAEKALGAHRTKMESAERAVRELTAAAALAEKLDAQAAAAARAKIRADQLDRFAAQATARDKIVAEMFACLDQLAAANARYVAATSALVAAVPAGASLPVMVMGNVGELGSHYGDLAVLLGAEAFRLTATHRGRLPFAKAPGLLHNNPRLVPPAADSFRACTHQVLKLVREQIAERDAADAAKLGEKAA